MLALISLVVVSACSEPSFVEEITFVNEGEFPAEVHVSGDGDSGWLAIGLVRENAETTFRQVIDQGDTWVFHFGYLSKHHQELEHSRSELERSEWTVRVPDEFEASLREMGFSPPP